MDAQRETRNYCNHCAASMTMAVESDGRKICLHCGTVHYPQLKQRADASDSVKEQDDHGQSTSRQRNERA